MGLVLVVDDNRDIAEALANVIELELQCEAAIAYDGEVALRMARERPVDLILLDFHMPGVSGLDVLRRLREESTGTPPPVIVCSQDEDAGEAALQLGAVAFVAKWHGIDAIMPLVRRHAS